MQIIDNINHIVKNDLQESIRTGSKLSIAAACFSIYAYQELKKQLESIDELRFIFTSPTFVTEKTPKAQREFYIPRISRERSLYGTEFEVKLRNELTQKAVAKECADWIRRKAIFKSNVTQEQMMGFMTVDESTYMPINGFTTVDLGCERGNNAYYPVQKTESYENANYFLKLFEQLWNPKARKKARLPAPFASVFLRTKRFSAAEPPFQMLQLSRCFSLRLTTVPSAMEASLLSALSERDTRMMGTRAPTIMPAARAPPRQRAVL